MFIVVVVAIAASTFDSSSVEFNAIERAYVWIKFLILVRVEFPPDDLNIIFELYMNRKIHS